MKVKRLQLYINNLAGIAPLRYNINLQITCLALASAYLDLDSCDISILSLHLESG